MFKILFNQNTSPYAEQNDEVNLMFIRQLEMYVNELLRARGYVYVNYIYESLGVEWDPKRENQCYIYNGNLIKFDVLRVEDGFEIIIN